MYEDLILVHKILTSLSGNDMEKRKLAENDLELIKCKGSEEFFSNLLKILNEESVDLQIRRLAGLILKNEIEKTYFLESSTNCNWTSVISEKTRKQFKQILFDNLSSSSKIIRRTVSQIFAKIAFIELKDKLWDKIFDDFSIYLSSLNHSIYHYEGILETIEFLFQEFFNKIEVFDILEKKTMIILEIILIPIKQTYKEENIIFTALKTLYTVLHFIDLKDLKELDFNTIISLIINQVTNSSLKIRKLSFEILEIITKQYYNKIDKFISVIFDLTLITIEQDHEEVSLKAIEFWSSLADEEFQININSIQALTEGRIPDLYSKQFIVKSGAILPFLLLNFIENKGVFGTDDWDCKTVVGLCLNFMIQAGPNEILPRVINFIENKIDECTKLKSKQVAVFSLISIFDGIGSKILYNHIFKTFFIWPSFSEYENVEFKQAIFFLFGKIFQISPFVLRTNLDKIIQLILNNICDKKNTFDILWILNEIFQSFEIEGCIDWYIETICSIILNLISQSISEEKVVDELFEIICSVVLNSSIRSQSQFFLLIPNTFIALKLSFNNNRSKSRETTLKIQPHLFRFIGSCIQRFGQIFTPQFLVSIVDFINILIKMLRTSTVENNLEDEIIIFIGSVIQKYKKESNILIKDITFILFDYLSKNIEHQSVAVAIGILGDICCSFDNLNESFMRDVTIMLINLLQNENIGLDTKPLVLSCLGDISFASGTYFFEFQNLVIPVVKSTIDSVMKYINCVDQDTLEWVLLLKESLLEILTGLIQGGPFNSLQSQCFMADVELHWLMKSIFNFISSDRVKRTTRLCIGVVGDYGANFEPKKKEIIKFTWIKQLIFESTKNSCPSLNFMGTWALDSIYTV
jgi:importin subunit beta-1